MQPLESFTNNALISHLRMYVLKCLSEGRNDMEKNNYQIYNASTQIRVVHEHFFGEKQRLQKFRLEPTVASHTS